MRVGYCLNVHPAEDLEQVLAGLAQVSRPLARRLAPGRPFGVGLYLPAELARSLSSETGRGDLERLGDFLAEASLDPFSANAFPYGGFHRAGLKGGVFRPTWAEPERRGFTAAVARVLVALARRVGDGGAPRGHLSISTHAGRFGPFGAGDGPQREASILGLARAALDLERLGGAEGQRLVLSLEAEPRSNANDSADLAAWIAELRERGPALLVRAGEAGPEEAQRALERSLGTCLDACHSAVEFEQPAAAVDLATRAPLGKLQFSSALSLADPGRDARARALFLGLDEPRYLHQVTGLHGAELLRATDLPDLAAALDRDGDGWGACSEWRCHFHVPVDLEQLGGTLGTTASHAEALLDRLLDQPARWGGDELHVELETYTWDVLPRAARGAGELVDGLEREVLRALDRLRAAGWGPPSRTRPESSPPR